MVAAASGSLSVPVEPQCVVRAPCRGSLILLTTQLAKHREHMSAGAHHQENLAWALEVEFEEASKPALHSSTGKAAGNPGSSHISHS